MKKTWKGDPLVSVPGVTFVSEVVEQPKAHDDKPED